MQKGKRLSYANAGVDIDKADKTKAEMTRILATPEHRLLNGIGAFASLYDASFPEYKEPVLVMKTEEPGSKQKLALEYGYLSSIGKDLIHHLVNDVIVMGARPLMAQDAIICGKLEKETILQLIESIAGACREQDCVLAGGETSEQPGVVANGIYILVASLLGVVEKSKVIDGSGIQRGDVVLAIASNGLHTNGYSLLRELIKEDPAVLESRLGGISFLDAAMKPHSCYYQSLKELFDTPGLHGMAHITGGGLAGNLNRILPAHLDAVIHLDRIEIPSIFCAIRDKGRVTDTECLKTFNMGVGLALVADSGIIPHIQKHISAKGCLSYVIGDISEGAKKVVFKNSLRWS